MAQYNVTTIEEARALANSYMNGEITNRADQLAAVAALEKFRAGQQAVEAKQAEPEAPPVEQEQVAQQAPNAGQRLVQEADAPTEEREPLTMFDRAVGALDVGSTLVTGAVGEVLGGWAGLVNLAMTGDINSAAADVQGISDMVTSDLHSEGGRRAIETVAKPLLWLDEKATDIAYAAASENPLAATYIKTAIIGVPELLGAKSATAKAAVLRQSRKRAQKMAEDLGVRLDERAMAADVIDAAARMSPEERAASMPALRSALTDARDAARREKTKLYDDALQMRAFVNVGDANALAKATRQSLINEGFDIETMPTLGKRLEELATLGTNKPGQGARKTPVLTAQLRDLETIRQRINRNMPENAAERTALNRVKREIDNMMDGNYRQTAISGDPAAIDAWKNARDAHRRYKQDFDENRIIKGLIMDQNASAEEMWRFAMGANAMGDTKNAISTMRALKTTLGADHPAVTAIRTDFIYEALSPLLQERPNLNQFINNYDRLIRRNRSLARELGVEEGAFSDLVKLARVANELPDATTGGLMHVRLIRQVAQLANNTASRLAFGHGMTKATMKVNLSRNILNALMGVNRITGKQILQELTGLTMQGPVIKPNSLDAAQFVIASSPLVIKRQQEDEERKRNQ